MKTSTSPATGTPPLRPPGLWTVELAFGTPSASQWDIYTNYHQSEASARRAVSQLGFAPSGLRRVQVWHRGAVVLQWEAALAYRPEKPIAAVPVSPFGLHMQGGNVAAKRPQPCYTTSRSVEELGL